MDDDKVPINLYPDTVLIPSIYAFLPIPEQWSDRCVRRGLTCLRRNAALAAREANALSARLARHLHPDGVLPSRLSFLWNRPRRTAESFDSSRDAWFWLRSAWSQVSFLLQDGLYPTPACPRPMGRCRTVITTFLSFAVCPTWLCSARKVSVLVVVWRASARCFQVGVLQLQQVGVLC